MEGATAIRDALAAATKLLSSIDNSDARADSQLLLMYVLQCDRAFLLANPQHLLSERQALLYQDYVARRVASEPVQYITGTVEFYGLPFEVNRDVLIPRPETEHLVEALLARGSKKDGYEIVDVGTGSGAIAIAVAHLLPRARVTALDNSSGALAVALRNAASNGVADRVRFLSSNLLAAVAAERFDAVISNPPYIADGDHMKLDKQIREFEPAGALFAGPSGLEIYARLIPQAWAVLNVGGWLLMEIGYGQQAKIASLLESWSEVSFAADLQGIPRVACARRTNF